MIIFTDLSEVLIRGAYGTEFFVEKRYGKEIALQYLQRREETNSTFCDLMRGKLSEDAYCRYFLQGTELPFEVSELKQFLSLNMARVVPGTIDVFQRIVKHPNSTQYDAFQVAGRPDIWLISDHISERKFELENLHPKIFNITSNSVWSFERGKIKSDTEFFQDLLAEKNLLSSEVIFIDDMEINTSSAGRAGIVSILFKNPEQLEKDMKALGFAFADAGNT